MPRTAMARPDDDSPVTDLDDLDDPDLAGTPTGPPVIPIVMLAITAVASTVLVVAAVLDDAGSTDDISSAALMAWALGSFLGLMIFAWFGWLDARRRSTGHYADATWRPRLVGVVLAVAGWLAGAAGAILVAQAVARR